MREEAERFCGLIETAESFEREAFLAALAEALSALIAAASTLPDVSPTDAEGDSRPSTKEVRARYEAIQRVLGPWGEYFTTLAPHGRDADRAVLLPLADDLVDIWADVKGTLRGRMDGMPETDVTWEWRFDFYSHWGRHATEALRALHARLAESGGPLPRPTSPRRTS